MITAKGSKNNAIDIEKNIKTLLNHSVKVGLPKETGSYPNGTSILQVGAAHEFGVPENNLPRRSFLRVPFMDNANKIKKAIDKSYKFVAEQNSDPIKMLNKLGLFGQSISQESFTDNNWQPLKPATIKRKSSSKPLIDSGRLRGSITYIVEKN